MILVVGATGSLGGKILRGLLERGERSAAVGIGDLRDRDSLDRACEGVHAVVTTASARKPRTIRSKTSTFEATRI